MPLCLYAASLVSCTDPRGRPVAPDVLITLQTVNVTSPGFLTHRVDVTDDDGLDSIVVHVVTGDSALAVDTVYIPFELYASSESFTWQVPAGVPVGTPITITAEAWDFADFVGADTVVVNTFSAAGSGTVRGPITP